MNVAFFEMSVCFCKKRTKKAEGLTETYTVLAVMNEQSPNQWKFIFVF